MVFGKPIPGETPIDDISGLKVKGITLRKELNILEAVNISKAAEKYLLDPISRQIAPFDYSWFLTLHREMFGDVWAWAGQLRNCDTNIGVPYHRIEQLLYELTLCLPYWVNLPLLEQAAMLHHRAVHIHPFLNGNGRWSRMLANIWLYLHKHPFTRWPEDPLGEESSLRTAYLEAIQTADRNNLRPLIELHEQFTSRP